MSPRSDLGVAVEYLHAEDGYVPSALVSGCYDNPYMIFMAAHYTYRF